MKRYDPERMELSTRDRVALAAYTELKEGRGTPRGEVWLDVSHLPREQIMERLPRVYQTLMELQMLDITTTPMESRRPRTTPWVESGCAPATTAPRWRVCTQSVRPPAGCTAPTDSAGIR
jgi:hypothetical protein